MVDKTFVSNLVSQGFSQISGLTDDISFSNSTSSSYDFTNLEPITTTPVVDTYSGVVGNVRRDASSRSFVVDVLFKATDLASADQYDTATFRSRTWNVLDYFSDGYTTTVSFGGS